MRGGRLREVVAKGGSTVLHFRLTHMSRNKKGPYSDLYLLFIRDSSSINKVTIKFNNR